MEVSSLPDPAVIRDANVLLIKDCSFCQKLLWGTLCSVQPFLLGCGDPAKGCSGQQ